MLMKFADWPRRVLAIAILGVLALALPALAADPRCETAPDRPHCAPPEEEPGGTTTTTAAGRDPGRDRSTTTTLPADPFDAVSVIGCSNTHRAAAGYLDISGSDLLVNTAWAGHTVEYWAVKDDGWNEHYLPLRPEDGFDGAWLNLCERADTGLTLENAETVLAKIWAIDPGIPVWVSPLNFYEAENCAVTNGNQIPTAGTIIADTLVATYALVERGPDLGPLTADHLRLDLCHPNQAGTTFLGSQLQAFFDD